MFASSHKGPDLVWKDAVLRPSRGGSGSGVFERIHYFDLSDTEFGQATTRILCRNGAAVGLSVVRSTGHEVGLEESSALTLLFPLQGRIASATDAFDLTAGPGETMILPPGRRRTVVQRPPKGKFEAITLTLPALSGRRSAVGAKVLRTSGIDDLANAAVTARSAARQADPNVLCTLLSAVQSLVEGALQDIASSPGLNGPMRGSQAILQRAEGLMRERSSEDLSILSLAQDIGISLRQLQDLFRRHYGRSPHAYLTRLRLERAHFLLRGKTPAPSVTDSALLAGFNHLGRFPQAYRDRFGTLPSRSRHIRPGPDQPLIRR